MKRTIAIILLLPLIAVLAAAQPSPAAGISVEKPGVSVTAEGIDKAYVEALASVLSQARKEYESAFGVSLPETVGLQATLDPHGRLRLWTDGESRLFLTLSSEDQLAPPPQSGVFNIYGMCHELGHIVMYRGLRSLAGLPEGVGEGWAHYAGSVVVDGVARRLGDAIWPRPYDVAATEGTARLERQLAGKDWKDLDAASCAAKAFYQVEKTRGRAVVGRCFREALAGRPAGIDFMPRFLAALRRITGDPSAGEWIPQRLLAPEVKWNVKERHPAEAFFEELKSSADDTGVLLSYDDGSSEGMRSMAGSGHAVLFRAPEGTWRLDGVDLFGARYGAEAPPDEDFAIYVCDEDFRPLHEFGRPYALFELGDLRWVRIDVPPCAVPSRFYVCVAFNPTAARGVYVGYDEGVARSHSRVALPYSHVFDVEGKFDWMIRAHLVRAAGP